MIKKILFLFFYLLLIVFCHAQNSQLQFYIDNALRSSPLLKDYQNQIQLNYYDSLLLKAFYKPQVNGSSYNTYAPVIKNWGYDGAITNGGVFTTLVGVNKSFPNKQNLSAQFQNINLLNQTISNTAQISQQDLKRNIIAQYITAFGSFQQLNFNKEINNLLLKEEIIFKKLTQANVYKQADYLAFLVTLQQQKLLVKQFSIQYKNDCATLNYLSGITDTSFFVIQNPNILLSNKFETKQSVFFKQFEIDSLKLLNNKTLVDVNYKPKINLFADAGYNSSFNNFTYKNVGTSFGVSLTIPIYDGKQKKLQYSKINIAENSRKYYKTFFNNQYNQQIAQLYQQLTATDELITEIKNQLKFTQSLIDVNGKLLDVGEVKVTDYILALNAFINAKNLITQNNINRLQIINQINYWNR